jgi:hypothetical protein
MAHADSSRATMQAAAVRRVCDTRRLRTRNKLNAAKSIEKRPRIWDNNKFDGR